MFDSLHNNLMKVFDKLRGAAVLTEDNISEALREVRIALLEADVALPVVKSFINTVKEKAVGTDVLRNIQPAQMLIKIVHDELTEMLGSQTMEINLSATPPAVIMVVGLQGSGKTTSTAKLAKFLEKQHNKKILMASLDIYRPAAQHQLEVLGKQVQIDTLPIIEGQNPKQITERCLEKGKLEAYDIILLDTAGRLHIDEALMEELQIVKSLSSPVETLLVADALTGQDAVNVASEFHEKVGITGIILTRIDGDGRGGAALSMRSATGQAIKFMGTGEKIKDFEIFHPERIASRILDMGDVVTLVEKAAETIDQEEAEHMIKRLQKGKFDMEDLLKQLRNLKKMGGMGGIMNFIPGIGKLKKQIDEAGIDESIFARQEAIILSMTKRERRFPKILNASRKKRIASGSGSSVQEVNKLMKQYQQMQNALKRFNKMSKKGGMGLGDLSKLGDMKDLGQLPGGMPEGEAPNLDALQGLSGLDQIGDASKIKDIEKILKKLQ